MMRDCIYYSMTKRQWLVWSMTKQERFSWGVAGSTYFAHDRERGVIVALMYWSEADLGQEEEGPTASR